MKIKNLFLSLTAAVMALSSCGNEDLELGNSTTAPADPNCPAVEFATNNTTVFEVDPSDTHFNLTVVRKATDAATYNIVIAENQENAFVVPSTVEFAAGEESKSITISMAENAPKGEALALALSFDDKDLNPYTTGLKTLEVKTTIIKWESFGKGYWIGGFVNHFFGVDALPLAVDIEKAVTANDVRFRFVSPYSSICTGDDGLGYIGYPYSEEGDLDGNVENFVITVTKNGASLVPLNIGINFGYGSFSGGSVYGYLSNNIASYPLGVYTETETGGKIFFAPNSLFVSKADYNDGGKYPCSNPSTLYLSAEDYMADMEE